MSGSRLRSALWGSLSTPGSGGPDARFLDPLGRALRASEEWEACADAVAEYNVSIDAAGRIVIPKPVRDRLRLDKGTILKLEIEEDGLFLSVPRPAGGCLGYEDGALIVTGELAGEIPSVDGVRRERLIHLTGL